MAASMLASASLTVAPRAAPASRAAPAPALTAARNFRVGVAVGPVPHARFTTTPPSFPFPGTSPPVQAPKFRSSTFQGRALLASTSSVSLGRTSLQVLAAKGKQMGRKIPGKSGPGEFRMPPLDPENPQFIIYVRSVAVAQWFPVSVVTGGSAAKGLVKLVEGDNFNQFFKDRLTANVSDVIYKDEEQIKTLVFKQYKLLQKAKALEWGYKIMDAENPRKSMMPTGVVKCPPPGDKKLNSPVQNALQNVQNMFKGGDK